MLMLRHEGRFLSLVMYATAEWENSVSGKVGMRRHPVGYSLFCLLYLSPLIQTYKTSSDL